MLLYNTGNSGPSCSHEFVPGTSDGKMFGLGVFAFSLCLLASGTPLSDNRKVLAKRDTPPAGYTLTRPASPDTLLKLRIALVQSNAAGLEEALYDVSTPTSPNYGRFLTKEEVCLSCQTFAVNKLSLVTVGCKLCRPFP